MPADKNPTFSDLTFKFFDPASNGLVVGVAAPSKPKKPKKPLKILERGGISALCSSDDHGGLPEPSYAHPLTYQLASTELDDQPSQDLAGSPIIGRLHAIPNWDATSTYSAESDDELEPSLMDVEWGNLEDDHRKLNPLWPESISQSLPPKLRTCLLSRPVCTQRVQGSQSQAQSCGNDERVHSNHSISDQSSLFGDDETGHTIGEKSSLLGGSDETNRTIDKTPIPASLPRDRTVLPNVELQSPAGQHYTRAPSNVGLQHPGVQHDARMSSSVRLQPPTGRHHAWIPSNTGMLHPGVQHDARMPSNVRATASGVQHNTRVPSSPLAGWHNHRMPPAGGMIILLPSNMTYPYATFPPNTQSSPSVNASYSLNHEHVIAQAWCMHTGGEEGPKMT
ncbi:hypothetical protein EV424DRAFT_1431176 [Suillus variegatus]|nr:hypothetical protein EV424DRAFT_1431176 [Suillus variegatus]